MAVQHGLDVVLILSEIMVVLNDGGDNNKLRDNNIQVYGR